MKIQAHCDACHQAVVVDFDADGNGVIPPHGAKRGDGTRSCPMIGKTVAYELPEDRRARLFLAEIEATRRRDEERKAREEAARERAAQDDLDRRCGLEPARPDPGHAALILGIMAAGWSSGHPTVDSSSRGKGRRRWPLPR